jgi:hypothetical protein
LNHHQGSHHCWVQHAHTLTTLLLMELHNYKG